MQALNSYLLVIFLTLAHTYGHEYKVTHQVDFEISVGKQSYGIIRIGLFGDLCPKTVKNFMILSTTGVDGHKYVGSQFHRIIEKFMIQGGDVVNGDGTGGISIYGPNFEDENFVAKHSCPGMVSMANSGPNTNGCQFFITTVATPFLDGKHVVFGKVVSGQNIVHAIEHLPRDSSDRPLQNVYIKSAKIVPTKPYYVSDNPYEYGGNDY